MTFNSHKLISLKGHLLDPRLQPRLSFDIYLPGAFGYRETIHLLLTTGFDIVANESYFRVLGGQSLSGEFLVQGAKNAVLKEMAATILATGEHHFYNVPRIVDVEIMAELLLSMGIKSEWASIDHLVISTPSADDILPLADYELVEKIRASITVLGPLIARLGKAKISMPGGDDFGHRPIDMHLEALSELGVKFTSSHGYIEAEAPSLSSNEISLEFPSHTGTDNVLMAAVLTPGHTIINNAAREPEVIDLGMMLNSMGAHISGLGTSTITVDGVEQLRPANHIVVPDRIDAATAIAAVAMNRGEVMIRRARLAHMEMLVRKLKDTGLDFQIDNDGFVVKASRRLNAVNIATLPYPGIATDYLPLLVSMLACADGDSIVTENLFSGRFKYVDELRRLGANMTTSGHHVAIHGVAFLSGAPVKATDIRAGAALLVAATAAEGETRVIGASHIQRGYQFLAKRLSDLGASVELVEESKSA